MRILTLLLFVAATTIAGPPKPRHPGFLGARLKDSSVGDGVLLTEVFPDTPAAKAGLKKGDIVFRIGDAAVRTAAELATQLKAKGSGAKVDVRVLRGTEKRTITVTLGTHPRILLEQPDTSPGMLPVTVERDLSYHIGSGEAHPRHKANLILPKTDKKFPVILWIHAGAWSYGDRRNETALGTRFAERGFGFAAISYRLSSKFWNNPNASKDGVKHPAHMEDCAMAFAWLKKRFPDRTLFVAGHSCGAHLGALLAMDPRYLSAHGLKRSDISGVVAIGGAYDMVKYHEALIGGLGKDKADAHLKWIFGDTPAEWREASPTTYLEKETVPMMIVSESNTHGYLEDFRKVVEAAGVQTIRFRRADDRTHGQSTPFMSRKQPDPIRDEMIAFLLNCVRHSSDVTR